MNLAAVYGIAGAAGGFVGAHVRAFVASADAGLERQAVGMVAGGVADVVVTAAVMNAMGARPTWLALAAIGLGSYAVKRGVKVDGATPTRMAIYEGAGSAIAGALVGAIGVR